MLQRFGLYRIKYVEGNQLLCGEVRNIEGPLWWVDLDWMPGASQAALSLSSSAGQQRKKIRWKKLMSQDKGGLIKQKQRLCVDAKENKRLIAYSHQQAMSSYFLGRTASVHVAISPEGKCIMMNVPHLLLALSFTAEQMSYVMEYPSLNQLSRLCSLPRSCPRPSLLVRRECWRANLDGVQVLLSRN